MKKGKITLTFNYKDLTFINFGIDISGTVDINGKSIPVSFVKKKKSTEGKISLNIDEIKVSDFTKMMSKKEVDDGAEKEDKSTSNKFDVISNAIVKNIQLSGSRSTDGFLELVLKGQASEIKGFKDLAIFIIIQKQADSPTAVAVIVDFKNIKPADILHQLLNQDFSNVPFIKDIELDVALEAANNDMMALKDAELNKVLAKYLAFGKTISEGFKLKFEFPARNMVKKMTGSENVKNIPEKITIQVLVKNGELNFLFPDDLAMDLANIAIAFLPKLGEGFLQNVMEKPPKVKITAFNVDVKTGDVDVKLLTTETVSIQKGLFKMEDVVFELSHKPAGTWEFKFKGTQKIGKDGVIDILVQKKGETFTVKGNVHNSSNENNY